MAALVTVSLPVDELVDVLSNITPELTRPWIHRGGSALRTLRERDPIDPAAIVNVLDQLGVTILYVIGGNGSLSAAHAIWEEIDRRGLQIGIAGIPKTMDNDILWIWKSFGFDTAVAEAASIINRLHDEAESNNRIAIVRLFGAKSGFVAANAALASGEVDAVLIPEENPLDLDRVVEHLRPRVAKNHHAMIVVAEGITVDPPTLVAQLRPHFSNWLPGRYDVFLNEPRHTIRAVPANPPEQIYCRRLADLAVDNALAGYTDFMISSWQTEYVLVPLDLVKNSTRQVPIGGIFWKEVRNSTGQPSFCNEAALTD